MIKIIFIVSACLAISVFSCIITIHPQFVIINIDGEVMFNCIAKADLINWRINGEPMTADLESNGFVPQPLVNLNASLNLRSRTLLVSGSLDKNGTIIVCVSHQLLPSGFPTNPCISNPALLLVKDPTEVTSSGEYSSHFEITPSLSSSTQLTSGQLESSATTDDTTFSTGSSNFITSSIVVSTSGTPSPLPPHVDSSTGIIVGVVLGGVALIGVFVGLLIVCCVFKKQATKRQNYEVRRVRERELCQETISSKVFTQSTIVTGQKSPATSSPLLLESKNDAVYQAGRADSSTSGTPTVYSQPCSETQKNADSSTQSYDSTTQLPSDDDEICVEEAKPMQDSGADGYNTIDRMHKTWDGLFSIPENSKIEGIKQSGVDNRTETQEPDMVVENRQDYESEADRESDSAQAREKSVLSASRRAYSKPPPSTSKDRGGDTQVTSC